MPGLSDPAALCHRESRSARQGPPGRISGALESALGLASGQRLRGRRQTHSRRHWIHSPDPRRQPHAATRSRSSPGCSSVPASGGFRSNAGIPELLPDHLREASQGLREARRRGGSASVGAGEHRCAARARRTPAEDRPRRASQTRRNRHREQGRQPGVLRARLQLALCPLGFRRFRSTC